MLEPREADVPVLFLVLVVLPVLAYFLLGKWSETTKNRERISLLAQLAIEEAFPLVATSKNVFHVCARCSAPSTTCCSRCKSVRTQAQGIVQPKRPS